MVVGGVGTTGRCYLVSVLPLRRGLLLEPPRGKTGGQRGGGRALTEAQPSFERVNHVLVGLSGGPAALVVCRIPYTIIENSWNQLHRTVATHSRFWSCSICISVLRSKQWVSLTIVSDCDLHDPAAKHLYQICGFPLPQTPPYKQTPPKELLDKVSWDISRPLFCVSHVIFPPVGPLTMFHGSLVTPIPFSHPSSLW